jgi:acyl carrier protein
MLDATHASVCSTVAAYVDVDPTRIKPEQWLRGDWGLSALELSGLAHRIKQVERIGIRGEDLAGIDTIAQLISLVRTLHGKRSAM